MKKLTILQWNIQHGGSKRISKILEKIKKYNSDIIVLTEYRQNRYGEEIKKQLYENGYIHQVYNSELLKLKSRRKKKQDINSVFIASKIEFEIEEVVRIPDNEERCIKIEIENISIYALYFPQKEEKKQLFKYIHEILKQKEDKKTKIFLGDFNTGKNDIDKCNSKCNFYCEKEFREIEDLGGIDAWRYINQTKKEFTWYSSKNGGFRIDHAFITKKDCNIISACEYIHGPREEKISDHSIMKLELKIEESIFV